MSTTNDRMAPNGNDVLAIYDRLRNNFDVNQNMLGMFRDLLNAIAYNPYMKKS